MASLSPEVRRRYGYVPPTAELQGLLQAAYSARDWQNVAELAAELKQRRGGEGPGFVNFREKQTATKESAERRTHKSLK